MLALDRRLPGLFALALLLPAALPDSSTVAQEPEPEAVAAIDQGDRVVLASTDDVLKIGNRVVATGKIHRVYTVSRVNGTWLFLTAEDVAGWARSDRVIPFDRALVSATARIEANGAEPTAADYNERGLLWADRGRPDLAEADFDEAIRLDPEWSLPRLNRGNVRLSSGRLDEAKRDLTAAAERSPLDPLPYYNRGLVQLRQDQPRDAYNSFGLALRVDPNHASSRFNRAATALALGIEGASADAEAYLALVGWYETLSPYAAMIAALEHLREDRPEQAAGLLTTAMENRSPESWPSPILNHLQGNLPLDPLLDAATTPDQQAEARSYAGLALLDAGDLETARPLLEWVVDRADPNRLPHLLARSALSARQQPAGDQPGLRP